MKNILKLSTIVLMLITLGCATKSKPEYTTKKYLQALKEKDWDTAGELTDEDMGKYLSLLNEVGMAPEISDIKNIKCDVAGNTAQCTWCCVNDPFFETINLRKNDDGKWEVVLPKNGDGS